MGSLPCEMQITIFMASSVVKLLATYKPLQELEAPKLQMTACLENMMKEHTYKHCSNILCSNDEEGIWLDLSTVGLMVMEYVTVQPSYSMIVN